MPVFKKNVRLTISWLFLLLFFRKFRDFFFFIGLLTHLIVSIYFLNTDKGLEYCFRLIFNDFIKLFILKVQFLLSNIYLCLHRWSQTLSKISNWYFFNRGCNKIKFFEYGLKIFQVGNLVQNVSLLVLSILFDLMPKTIHKCSWIIKVFIQKSFEFVLDRQNQIFIIQLLFVLLLVETKVILKKKY